MVWIGHVELQHPCLSASLKYRIAGVLQWLQSPARNRYRHARFGTGHGHGGADTGAPSGNDNRATLKLHAGNHVRFAAHR